MKTNCTWAFVIAGILATAPAIADKPSWAGGGKGEKSEHREQSEDRKSGHRDGDHRSQRDSAEATVRVNEYFGYGHRLIVHDYYSEQFRAGRCPPGLAKKHDGCMPPGQARRWTVGRPLPPDVIYYEVPPPLVAQFGQPPAGYRYVRVTSDILLIALGTGMVLDGIRNLGRM